MQDKSFSEKRSKICNFTTMDGVDFPFSVCYNTRENEKIASDGGRKQDDHKKSMAVSGAADGAVVDDGGVRIQC